MSGLQDASILQVGILFPHINDDARSKSHQKSPTSLTGTHIGITLQFLAFLGITHKVNKKNLNGDYKVYFMYSNKKNF